MSIRDREIINVLNYNFNMVIVSTKSHGYIIPPSPDGISPSILPLSPSEIEYINSSSSAFKSGILSFEEDLKEEIYETLLRLPDWKNILFIDDIKDIILNPTIDKMQKLIKIKDLSIFERVRGLYTKLKSENKYDISTRVEDVINSRYRELLNRQYDSSIIIKEKVNTSSANEEIVQYKEANEKLMKEMQEMKELMASLLAQKQSENVPTSVATSLNTKTNDINDSVAKKAGRPKNLK